MYAAAGGASLASRQARRNVKKQHVVSSDAVHQQFQRRFAQLHQEHARLYTDLNGRIPVPGGDLEGKAAAAWSERERRSSIPECSVTPHHHHHHRVKVSDNHRKWTRKNRIHDSSFGGSSSEEEEPTSGLYGHQSAAANALLYVGLGTVAIGLVIAFVGTGEKGFKTLELRLIGPTLIGSGVLCCLIRVFLCVCPSHCLRRNRRKRGPPDNEYYRHLPYNARTAEDFMPSGRSATRDKKRVSIIPTPSTSDKKFIDETRNNAAVPRVPLPNFVESPAHEDNPIEMRRLEGANSFDDLPSISSEDSFNEPESLALVEGSKKTCVVRDMTSAERLARLKSTLTFQEEEPTDCPRIEEEDSETLDPEAESPPTTPMLASVPPPLTSILAGKRELVLSPAKLQNI